MLSNLRLEAQTASTRICQNLSVWSCRGFNFIYVAAIGELLVPGNVEKFTLFAIHLVTLTLSNRGLKILTAQMKKPPEGGLSIFWLPGVELNTPTVDSRSRFYSSAFPHHAARVV